MVPRIGQGIVLEEIGSDFVALDSSTGQVQRISGPAADALRKALTGHAFSESDPEVAYLVEIGVIEAGRRNLTRRQLMAGTTAVAGGVSLSLLLPSAAQAQSEPETPETIDFPDISEFVWFFESGVQRDDGTRWVSGLRIFSTGSREESFGAPYTLGEEWEVTILGFNGVVFAPPPQPLLSDVATVGTGVPEDDDDPPPPFLEFDIGDIPDGDVGKDRLIPNLVEGEDGFPGSLIVELRGEGRTVGPFSIERTDEDWE